VTFRVFEALTVDAVREQHDQLATASHESLARIAELERQNAELRQALEALSEAAKTLQQK
jgi:Mg2+ and Co2+ transporter CorA